MSDQEDKEAYFQKWLKATLTPLKAPHYLEKKRMAEYHASPGANGSVFLEDTTLQMKYAAMEPSGSTYATTLGDAVHIATLEPERFDKVGGESEFFQYVPSGQGLKSKSAKEAFEADPSRPVVTPELISKARFMRDAILGPNGNRLARELLSATADKELSGYAWDNDLQLIKKIRIDFRPKEGNFICDIKSTGSINERDFWTDVRKFRYHAKSSFYLDVDSEIMGKLPRELFFLIAVTGPKGESEGVHQSPYMCRVFEVNSPVEELSLTAEGRAYYRSRLGMFAHAAHTSTWEAFEHQSEAEVLTIFKPGFNKREK